MALGFNDMGQNLHDFRVSETWVDENLWIRTLELVRENCTGLTILAILEAPLHDIIPLEVYHEDTDRQIVADGALELVDIHLRDISSLQDIIVHVYAYGKYKNLDYDVLKNPPAMSCYRRCDGWTNRITGIRIKG